MLACDVKRVLSCLALASAVTFTSCQKEDLLENQFAAETIQNPSEVGRAIEGQYIVVLKSKSDNLQAIGVSNLSTTERVQFKTLREQTLKSANIASENLVQNFDGIVNGFAAKLTPAQVEELKANPNVAYIEQDRMITLAGNGKDKTLKNGDKDSNVKGKEKEPKAKNTKKDKPKNKDKNADKPNEGKSSPAPSEPGTSYPKPTQPSPAPKPTPPSAAPTPTEPDPVPTEPAPSQPTPVAPTPTVPETPVEPTPTASAYPTLTPLAGENVPWNIERVGYGDGTGKTVWIIDSGIDTDHPDLTVDLSRSMSFIYGNASIEDGYGHGTSVAGIVAAKNNGSGMIGVAANATVVALRVFDDAGAGSVSRAISAVNYVSLNAKPGDVVNLSLGSGISSTLDNAVKAAASKGILFAIAAGNSGVDCANSSPARVDAPGVYTVSAIDSYDRLWSSSNYGSSVDFAAPGVNVTTTTKGGGVQSGGKGTSFAAPHVAGILLMRGTVFAQGTIHDDKDNTPDPIASIK